MKGNIKKQISLLVVLSVVSSQVTTNNLFNKRATQGNDVVIHAKKIYQEFTTRNCPSHAQMEANHVLSYGLAQIYKTHPLIKKIIYDINEISDVTDEQQQGGLDFFNKKKEALYSKVENIYKGDTKAAKEQQADGYLRYEEKCYLKFEIEKQLCKITELLFETDKQIVELEKQITALEENNETSIKAKNAIKQQQIALLLADEKKLMQAISLSETEKNALRKYYAAQILNSIILFT
ncbi:hypothetical protein HYV11_02000 [Candidatus Dependentiae bacterium]|nr:hypothetical protein [Candidatus Dependentiae bacterium]